jgi:6-phosphogluconolactonase
MTTAPTHPGPPIEVYDSLEQLEEAAAQAMASAAEAAVRERGTSLLVLSGGETPRGVYRRLATPPWRDRIDWAHVHLLFGDERIVPPDHPLSNYGMVQAELLSRVPIPAGNIHRIRGELNPDEAVRSYEDEVTGLLASAAGRFDFALLGVGEDGHTASLFPGKSTLVSPSRPIVSVPGPKAWRVSMTAPLLNGAREIVFLVAGERKASIVRRILELNEPTPDLPASLIRPSDGRLLWMLDREAAAALDPSLMRQI